MIVIGAGRIGAGLKVAAEAHGRAVTLVDRTSGWESLDGGAGDPVVLAVRNDDLAEVLTRIPPHRKADLVFVQNGAIRELLADHGLSGATRGILYVLAARRDTAPVPGGNNVFSGPRAEETVRWWNEVGLPSKVVEPARFPHFELEKLLWLACNGLLCERYAASVGAIAEHHRAELAALVHELAAVGEAAWALPSDRDRLVNRILKYSRAIPEYRASVKEWPWRNGWLQARAREHGVPTPLHDALLVRTRHP